MKIYKYKVIPAPYPNTVGYDDAINNLRTLGECGYDIVTIQHGLIYLKQEIDANEQPKYTPIETSRIEPINYGTLNLSEIEKITIMRALEECKWHRDLAAAKLGLSERTLYRKINDYGLDTLKGDRKRKKKKAIDNK